MSRIDEAMRRAAEDAKANGSEPESVPEVTGVPQDTETLAKEPFPLERPGARPAHEPSSTTIRLAPAPSSRTESESRTEATGDARSERLFERFDQRLGEKLVVDQRMSASCREQYRRLAAVLHDAQAAKGAQVVMIASAVAGEGKTLTAANLALTLSGSYRKRVLLIDGDLRRPAVHQVFRIDTSFGLTDGLDPTIESKMVVRQITSTLAVLPAGRPTTDPMAALISDRMRRLIGEARETFEWIIIDTPPLVLLPDANLLASMVDAALIVVRAESTPHGLVKRATDAVGRNRVLGVVLNSATVPPNGGYDSYHQYYVPTGTDIVGT